jgi:hypothetical protein
LGDERDMSRRPWRRLAGEFQESERL